jgi:hypothetical protein
MPTPNGLITKCGDPGRARRGDRRFRSCRIQLPRAAATETLDLRTGVQLWRLPGDVIDATPETALLGGERAPLREVRMADGRTIWSRPAGGAVSWAVAGRGQPSARVVAAGADGRVIADLGDGTPVWDYEHTAPLYYLRPVELAGLAVEVSRIHLQTGRLDPRGLLSQVGYPGCTADNDKLICGTTNGKLTITHVA